MYKYEYVFDIFEVLICRCICICIYMCVLYLICNNVDDIFFNEFV